MPAGGVQVGRVHGGEDAVVLEARPAEAKGAAVAVGLSLAERRTVRQRPGGADGPGHGTVVLAVAQKQALADTCNHHTWATD